MLPKQICTKTQGLPGDGVDNDCDGLIDEERCSDNLVPGFIGKAQSFLCHEDMGLLCVDISEREREVGVRLCCERMSKTTIIFRMNMSKGRMLLCMRKL